MYELILVGIIIVLAAVLFFVAKMFFMLKKDYDELLFSKRSQSVKYGQLTEQWIPFSKSYPYDPQNFRFIGNPIDGVSFEDDRIVFVEFKANTSQLNGSQKKVKQLVEEKKIEWLKLRVD